MASACGKPPGASCGASARGLSCLCMNSLLYLSGWLDVLIQLEEVGRVILVFQGNQPVVVGPISRPYPLLALIAEKVDVDAAQREGTRGRPEHPRPPDMPLRVAIFPGRHVEL